MLAHDPFIFTDIAVTLFKAFWFATATHVTLIFSFLIVPLLLLLSQ